MNKINYKSRRGFTLIELLVVIGILAVLAAIAIPSVAGLIDRANVSADNTNADEMANAMERFASEYELYCQDIASGTLDPNNLDSAQGRIYNITKATERRHIELLESDTGYDGICIDKDTKYPNNKITAKAVIANYMKATSSTFDPKQSDMNFYYSPTTGSVIVEIQDSNIEKLNSKINYTQENEIPNKDSVWYNLTKDEGIIDGTTYAYGQYIYTFLSVNNGWSVKLNERVVDKSKETSFDPILEEIDGYPITSMNRTFENCIEMTQSPSIPSTVTRLCWTFKNCTKMSTMPALSQCTNLINMEGTFYKCKNLTSLTEIPNSVENMCWTFTYCTKLVNLENYKLPDNLRTMSTAFSHCVSLEKAPMIPSKVINFNSAFAYCQKLTSITINSSKISMYSEALKNTNISTINGACSQNLKDALLNTK